MKMKKILLLIFAFVLCSQTIKAQVVLDANGVTIKWTGTTVPSPYFVQASPRGTMEWFVIVSDSTKNNITDYAKNISSGITYFTRPGSSTPVPFNNIVTSLLTNTDSILKHTQERILNGKLPTRTLIWYCWNGTHYPCKNNKLPLTTNRAQRNTGLVFQNY